MDVEKALIERLKRKWEIYPNLFVHKYTAKIFTLITMVFGLRLGVKLQFKKT